MSDFRRFFVGEMNGVIEGDEFYHGVSVLRIKDGDEIIVCDNSAYEYLAKVEKVNISTTKLPSFLKSVKKSFS